jgi:hypothetical protein
MVNPRTVVTPSSSLINAHWCISDGDAQRGPAAGRSRTIVEADFVPLAPGALGSVWVTLLKSPANQ